MNTQEIQEQLQDNQELTIKLGERMNNVEKILATVTEIKDYSAQFEELKGLIIKSTEQDKSTSFKEKIDRHTISIQNLAAIFQELIKRQETIFRDFPKELQVKLLHRFEDKTKGFILGGLILFVLSAVLTGVCLHLWSDNGKMKDNDIKFRMVQQLAPEVAHKVDTLYYSDPEDMEKKIKQLEVQQIALAKDEAVAKQRIDRATKAKKKARELKNKFIF